MMRKTQVIVKACLLLGLLTPPLFAQEALLQQMELWHTKGKHERIRRKGLAYLRDYPQEYRVQVHVARAFMHRSGNLPARQGNRYFEQGAHAWIQAVRTNPEASRRVLPQFTAWVEDTLAWLSYPVEYPPLADIPVSSPEGESMGANQAASAFAEANPPRPKPLAPLREPATSGFRMPAWAQAAPDLIAFPNRLISREALLQTAVSYKGTPYRWGGLQPKTGFDCSGFVLHVMRSQGMDFSHGTRYAQTLGWDVPERQVQPGDWVFFGDRDAQGRAQVNHMGLIYRVGAGKRQVIHATNRGVVVDDLNEGDYWTPRILFFRNPIDAELPR